ncbi:hypothetical protein AKJ16_DCAP17591 [Drosera capensis]
MQGLENESECFRQLRQAHLIRNLNFSKIDREYRSPTAIHHSSISYQKPHFIKPRPPVVIFAGSSLSFINSKRKVGDYL